MKQEMETGLPYALIEFSNTVLITLFLVILSIFYEKEHIKKALQIQLSSTLKIQRCKPIKPIWSFSNTKDEHKIFVNKLDIGVDKSKLRQAFSKVNYSIFLLLNTVLLLQYGEIKDIRLTVKPTTAFAYIEYATKEAADASLVMNGKDMDGRVIGVAISDPSKKKVIT